MKRTFASRAFAAISFFCRTWTGRTFAYDPHGRQGIGINQPQSGIDWPFVAPSTDIRYLIADMFLAYEDPADYPRGLAVTPYTQPLQLSWLYGVGLLPAAPPPTAPTPVHEADLRIVDAAGHTVFDSTLATDFSARDWATYLRIFEWRDAVNTCRLVVYTAWPPVTEPAPHNYPLHIVPTNGTLDTRVGYRLPRRVKSLTAVLDNITRVPVVDLVAGYNMALQHSGTVTATGGRRAEQITLNATAGAGLGVYPGCAPQALVVNGINQVQPTAAGDFHFAATACYWARRVTTVHSRTPWVVAPALPITAPGTSQETLIQPAWPPTPAVAHFQVGGDCGPCCSCSDYLAVARYLNRVRDRYAALGSEAEATRDQYHTNRTRWLASRTCCYHRPVRVFLRAQRCPLLDVALQFCNQSDQCRTNIELTATFTSGSPGVVLSAYTFITGAQTLPGRVSGDTEPYVLLGSYPKLSAHWDTVQPYQSVFVRFRLDYGDCTTPLAVTALLTGTADGAPITVTGPGGSGLVTAQATMTTTLNCPPANANAGTYCPAV